MDRRKLIHICAHIGSTFHLQGAETQLHNTLVFKAVMPQTMVIAGTATMTFFTRVNIGVSH